MSSPLPRFSPGDVFDQRYVIVEAVGSGGMGDVYKATDEVDGRTVALKLLRREAAERAVSVERFEREIHLARRVAHANVCRMHEIGDIRGTRYFSMEFVDGQTLGDIIQSMGRLSPRQTVSLLRQIAAGLQAIHDEGIVHRDLKPGNIMLDRSGRAVVMDFGLASAAGCDRLTSEGEVLGTLSYLSPEQAQGKPADPRSDVYALGLILFEMLTGARAPGDGERVPLALRRDVRCVAPSQLSPEVTDELDAIVLRCLQTDPQERYPTAKALDEDLARVQDFGSADRTAPAAPRWPGMTRARVGAVLVLAIILAWVGHALLVKKPSIPAPGIALLPMAYEGPEQTTYLANLVPLVLEEELQESGGLDVVPFGSSRAFESNGTATAVASGLGVDYVLMGELRNNGTRIESALALVSSEGDIRWSGSTNSSLNDVKDALAGVASELRSALRLRATKTPRPSLPRSAQALARYSEAMMYLEGWDVEQNHERAVDGFRSALELDETFVEAKSRLAMALWVSYLETRETALVAEAELLAREARSEAPWLPEAHLASGIVALGQGRSVEAAASLAEAERLAPGNDDVCRKVAEAFERLGRDEEAEAMYRRAAELRPSYFRHANDLGALLLHRGRFDEAKSQFLQVIRLSPERHTGYANLAGVHLLAGEIEQAEPLLEAAVRLHASDSAHNNLGFVYYSTGRFDDAATQYRRAVEIAPADASYRSNLADAYRQLGRTEQAAQAYLRAIELERADLEIDPENHEARVGLSMSLAGVGRCDEAFQEASHARNDSHGDPTIQYYAAITYAVCGDEHRALDAAAAAVRGGVVADVRTNPDLDTLLDREPLRSLLN